VDRSGVAVYLHLVRAPDDPTEASRDLRQARGVDSTTWKASLGPATREAWRGRFLQLLEDGRPRTFNRLMLEASGGVWSADRAFDKAPDHALWALVRDGVLEHTFAVPVLFRRRAGNAAAGVSSEPTTDSPAHAVQPAPDGSHREVRRHGAGRGSGSEAPHA
jgi:hypothetical protein